MEQRRRSDAETGEQRGDDACLPARDDRRRATDLEQDHERQQYAGNAER